METELCWFCEKNFAVESRKYPKPYLIAIFKNDSLDSQSEKIELKIPRCKDCARVHIQTDIAKWPMKVGLPTVIAYIISIIALQNSIEFSNGGFLALGACLPSSAVLGGMIIYLRFRKYRLLKSVKNFFDIYKYPPFIEMNEINTYEDLRGPLTRDQRINFLSKKPVLDTSAGNLQGHITKFLSVEEILSNISEEEWNYQKYSDVLHQYPIEVRPAIVDRETWDTMLKKDQYDVRNLLLKQVVDNIRKMQD